MRWIIGMIVTFSTIILITVYSALIVGKRSENDYYEKNDHTLKDTTND